MHDTGPSSTRFARSGGAGIAYQIVGQGPIDLLLVPGFPSHVELAGNDVAGVGVHIAARIMALAEPGEVLVSSVVRDLALGSGLDFADRGRRTLKGIDGEWTLFASPAAAASRAAAGTTAE